MAVIRPFRAVRPVPAAASRVAAVPYDVVDTEEARALAAANPLSFLHVSRAEIDLPDTIDPHDDLVYRTAAERYRWLKREALRLLSAETAEFAAKAGVRVTRVGIGDPRSRWGSCAASGAIRYSWRLILAPAEIRRATVAHEVAHLRHLDHSPEFHAFHAELYGGETRSARRWLRMHGPALHAIR